MSDNFDKDLTSLINERDDELQRKLQKELDRLKNKKAGGPDHGHGHAHGAGKRCFHLDPETVYDII